MKKVELTGALRQGKGTTHAQQIRRAKRVPCVLYGGEKNVHFSVDEKELGKVVFTPETYRFELNLDGNKTMALLHETQFHPVTDKPLHVDFIEMNEAKESRVNLSVKLVGAPAGVKKGGRLVQSVRKLTVKGLPARLPEHLEIDIAELDINDSIHVADLKFEGLTFLAQPTDVVVAVRHARKVEEVAPVAGAAAAPAAGAPAAPAAAGAAAAAPAKKPAAKK